MAEDPFNLSRFVRAQEGSYATALSELRQGSKRSHWMWFVFPQLAGLGSSDMARVYGLSGVDEARAYLAHPLLGPRLLACVEAMLAQGQRSPTAILGGIDAIKFRSCLTLFALAQAEGARRSQDGAPDLFQQALQQFYGGEPDPVTLARLGHHTA